MTANCPPPAIIICVPQIVGGSCTIDGVAVSVITELVHGAVVLIIVWRDGSERELSVPLGGACGGYSISRNPGANETVSIPGTSE